MRERNKTLAISASLRQRSVDAGGGSGSSMTLAKLRAIVAEAEGPSTPLAITRLALNCQLLMDVGPDIGAFAEVQQLLLNQNKIRRIQHLGALQQLRCLCRCCSTGCMRACIRACKHACVCVRAACGA
eukprot:366119-Chlamydomonas_euryale.AAC.29